MPVKPVINYKFTAWSYSRLSDYLLCPLKAKLKHLVKLKEPGSPAMERGSYIHERAASFISGKTTPRVPTELKNFKEEFKAFRKLKATVEQQWAFTKAWEPCDWFAKEAWVRVVVDTYHLMSPEFLHIVDHKTGKVWPGQEEQLELYALAGFAKFPDVKRILTRYWYIDLGEEKSCEFTRSEEKALKKKWESKTKPMMNDKMFAPRPNEKCRWCHWRAEKGGPCKM